MKLGLEEILFEFSVDLIFFVFLYLVLVFDFEELSVGFLVVVWLL